MKDGKIKILILLPIVGGIALLAAGIITSRYALTMAGVGVLFGGSFLVALIMSIVTVVGVFRGGSTEKPSATDSSDGEASSASADDGEEDDGEESSARPLDEREKERRRLERINTTYGYENKLANAEHQIAHVKSAWRASDNGDKIKGCVFVLSFIACLIGGMVLLGFGYIVPGVIVFACAFLIIIGALVVVKIKEHISTSVKFDKDEYTRKYGVVKSCSMSSSASVGSGRTSRVTSVVYRVKMEVDGLIYSAYSRVFYNEGDRVRVLLHKSRDIVKIVDGMSDDLDGDDIGAGDARELADKREERISALTEEYENRAAKAPSECEVPAPKADDGAILSDNVQEDKSEEKPAEERPSTHRPNPGYKGIKRK